MGRTANRVVQSAAGVIVFEEQSGHDPFRSHVQADGGLSQLYGIPKLSFIEVAADDTERFFNRRQLRFESGFVKTVLLLLAVCFKYATAQFVAVGSVGDGHGLQDIRTEAAGAADELCEEGDDTDHT